MPFVQIVRSKLHLPRVPGDLVVRNELLAVLEAGSGLPLTLLVAPAGYGKTVLVSHWLAARNGTRAWLSLDEDDSDPIVFVSYLVAAVRTAMPDACAETQRCLNGGQPPSVSSLAGSLSNDLEVLPTSLVLVLDNYHRIDSPQTHALLDRLLVHPASALRLVVLARHDPVLSLGALRVREAMREIRLGDLQFSRCETAMLIERCAGLAISGELLDCLQERTEGWPVGVRLAALALRHGGAAYRLEHGVSGVAPLTQQYFLEEVLAQQSGAVRDCLLRTSILERLCGPLCDAVLGEGVAFAAGLGGQTFMQLVAGGAILCIAIDDLPGWYRYHRLFREFLQEQLRSRHAAGDIADLHRRAALWLEAQDLLEEAIPHALAAESAVAAGRLLARHHQILVNREQRQRLERCLRLLPPDSVEDAPELLLLKAWLMYHQERHLDIPAVLDRIEALSGEDIMASLRGGVLALRSLQRYLEGRADLAIGCAEQALQCLPAACAQARVTAQAVIAGARQMRGDLSGARQWIHQALAHALGPIDVCQAPLVATLCFIDWMAGDLSALQRVAAQHYKLGEACLGRAGTLALGRYFHGLVHYQRNELALAEAMLLPVLAPQQAPRLGCRSEGSFVLAAVYQALGQADRARAIVDGVCAHLLRKGDSPALFRAQACQAELALRQGRIDEARDWARNFDPGPLQFVYRFFNAPHLTLARVWIAEGSAESREQAGRLLQLLEAELATRHNVRFLIEVLALQALLQQALGNPVAASDALGRALALAQPAGFIRLFVDLGQDLVTPLKRVDLSKGSAGSARYVGQILAAFNADWLVSAGRQQVGGDLTRRELKILKLLAIRLTNVEISEELCISRATVKRHTQNIYRKLRASSRGEAVFRARTLNILADG